MWKLMFQFAYRMNFKHKFWAPKRKFTIIASIVLAFFLGEFSAEPCNMLPEALLCQKMISKENPSFALSFGCFMAYVKIYINWYIQKAFAFLYLGNIFLFVYIDWYIQKAFAFQYLGNIFLFVKFNTLSKLVRLTVFCDNHFLFKQLTKKK